MKHIKKLLTYILKLKKWIVNRNNVEYAMHFFVTDYVLSFAILYLAVTGNATYLFLVPVAGFLINHIGEVAMRDANIKDSLWGTAGITIRTIITYGILLVLQHYGLYKF